MFLWELLQCSTPRLLSPVAWRGEVHRQGYQAGAAAAATDEDSGRWLALKHELARGEAIPRSCGAAARTWFGRVGCEYISRPPSIEAARCRVAEPRARRHGGGAAPRLCQGLPRRNRPHHRPLPACAIRAPPALDRKPRPQQPARSRQPGGDALCGARGAPSPSVSSRRRCHRWQAPLIGPLTPADQD
jgi:hypothetical protein